MCEHATNKPDWPDWRKRNTCHHHLEVSGLTVSLVSGGQYSDIVLRVEGCGGKLSRGTLPSRLLMSSVSIPYPIQHAPSTPPRKYKA